MIEHPSYAPPDTIDVSNNLLAANEVASAFLTIWSCHHCLH